VNELTTEINKEELKADHYYHHHHYYYYYYYCDHYDYYDYYDYYYLLPTALQAQVSLPLIRCAAWPIYLGVVAHGQEEPGGARMVP
jgi:hypothetical protein